MAIIPQKRRWTSKPVNRPLSSIAKSLYAYIPVLNGNLRELLHNRNITDTTTHVIDSKESYALYADGTSSKFYLDEWPQTGAYTISMWIKPASVTTQQYISDGYDGSSGNDRSIILGYQSGYVNVFNNGYPTGTASDTQMPVVADVWQHILYTTDGTKLKGYVNGVEHVNVSANLNVANPLTRYTFGANHVDINDYTGYLSNIFCSEKAVSKSEAILFYRDRYQLFQSRTIYLPVETAVAPPTGAIMNQMQSNNMGADLFNGTIS